MGRDPENGIITHFVPNWEHWEKNLNALGCKWG